MYMLSFVCYDNKRSIAESKHTCVYIFGGKNGVPDVFVSFTAFFNDIIKCVVYFSCI